MRHKNSKSIVFIQPDYHCSFIYRNELRRLGWNADVFLTAGFPKLLLYSEPDIQASEPTSEKLTDRIIALIKNQFVYMRLLKRYKYHFYNGNLQHFDSIERVFRLKYVFGSSFRVNLLLAKIAGCKIIFHPSGAPDEEMPVVIRALGNDEEGVAVRDTKIMKMHFKIIRRYSDMNIGYGFLDSSQYQATHIKYRSIDLDLWHPHITPPPEHQLPPTTRLRILHSFMFGKERMAEQGGNIKGSSYVYQAVEKLINEGYEIELISFNDIGIADYRFYQIQADIVVEELIRGSWGSTAVESMALGLPVITYVRPDWERRFLSLFPDTFPLPIINANKWTIYAELKKLLDDPDLRKVSGLKSREFALKNFNPSINVPNFAELIQSLP